MRFLVEAFDKKTDFQTSVIELPENCTEQLKSIMGWKTEQQGWEGYDLNQQQIKAIEALIQKSIEDPRYYFQLTCNGR
ncbi:DUF7683 domain-containing protein [Pseudomonas sp. A34-9]|uniref:DUF7683 domain-containing protein n=1 Tax=Pseudomonas sp. A34-9 TaxID=3034675 RepID=UPI00240E0D91|nr:hypothetical protein [Pseudomonas sp. A34-9]